MYCFRYTQTLFGKVYKWLTNFLYTFVTFVYYFEKSYKN